MEGKARPPFNPRCTLSMQKNVHVVSSSRDASKKSDVHGSKSDSISFDQRMPGETRMGKVVEEDLDGRSNC